MESLCRGGCFKLSYHMLTLLGVKLKETSTSGFMVRHNSDSSLVVDVKSMQHLDPLLMEFKE